MVKNLILNGQNFLHRQQSSILSAASIITAAVFLSSLLGFVLTRLLISYFFQSADFLPGAQLDAYYVAFRIPDFVFQLLVIGALSAAFIPVFSKYQRQDEHEAYLVANSMMNLLLLIFIAVSGVIFIFAEPLNDLFTGSNFTPDQLRLAGNFTRIMLLSQLFFAVSSFMTGIIQAHHRFIIPALAPLLYNLGIIAGIVFLGPTLGLYSAAAGVVFGAFLHAALQIPFAIKLGYHYQPVLRLNHPGVKQISRLMLPRALALSVDQIEMFAFTFLATTLSQGSLLIFTLALKLMKAPVRIFGVPIGQASLPFLSKESAHSDITGFAKTLTNSLHQIIFLALPATAVLIVLRIPLVRILYGAKDFPWSATLLTGRMLAIMSLGIFAFAAAQLLNRAYYALQNTKTPLIIALISIAASILPAYYLVLYTNLGVLGIAVGSTLGALTQAFLLTFALGRQVPFLSRSNFFLPILKMTLASSITGLILWFGMRFTDQFIFDTTRTLPLVLLTITVCLVGAAVYLSLSKLLKIQQFESYLRLLRRLGNWRKVLNSSQEPLDQTSSTV